MQILVAKNGAQQGPFSEQELASRVGAGEFSGDDLGWYEGLPAWVPLAQIVPASAGAPVYAGAPADFGTPATFAPAAYAGFWLRFVAVLIDGILLQIPGVILQKIFGQGAVVAIASLVLGWLYFAYLESSEHQATLGKKLLGLKVTDENGNRVSFGRASGRHFAKYLSAVILLIGFIMAGFTARKQALHDMVAGCLVVRK